MGNQFASAARSSAVGKSFYELSAVAAQTSADGLLVAGETTTMDAFAGRVCVLVNVASQCGLTAKNYTQLERLNKKYASHGLEILAFPCNQFGGQEPGSLEDIERFFRTGEGTASRFSHTGASFRLFDKCDVNGSDTHEIFVWAKGTLPADQRLAANLVKWNFTKFVVNRDGQAVRSFGPKDSPKSMESCLRELLGVTGEVAGAWDGADADDEEEAPAAAPAPGGGEGKCG